MLFLSVKNNGNELFKAKYNGQEYEFVPKKKTTITSDAARHIFGLGLADKREVLSRHGKLSHSTMMEQATAWLNSFSFEAQNDDPEPDVVDAPAPAEKAKEKEQGSAPLQLGTGAEAEVPDGAKAEVPAPILKGGNILDNIPTLAKK